MLPGAASATESKEFKRVKQKIEVSSAVFGHFDVVDWAVIQCFGDAAINAGEMVLVPFDRGIESFTSWAGVGSAPNPVGAIGGDCDTPSPAPCCALRSSSGATVGHSFRRGSPAVPVGAAADVRWWMGREQSWRYAATNQRVAVGRQQAPDQNHRADPWQRARDVAGCQWNQALMSCSLSAHNRCRLLGSKAVGAIRH